MSPYVLILILSWVFNAYHTYTAYSRTFQNNDLWGSLTVRIGVVESKQREAHYIRYEAALSSCSPEGHRKPHNGNEQTMESELRCGEWHQVLHDLWRTMETNTSFALAKQTSNIQSFYCMFQCFYHLPDKNCNSEPKER